MQDLELKAAWDKRYASPEFRFGTDPNEFLAAQLSLLAPSGKRILLIGEGEGRNAIWLASHGALATMVDISPVGLAKAASRAASLNLPLTTIEADLTHWDFGHAAWDAIIAIFCHLPSSIRQPINRKIVDALAPGGLYIAESYTVAQLTRGTGGPSDPDMLPSAAQLTAEFSGLEFLHRAELTRNVVEGPAHSGLADVVQIIARK